MVALIAGMVGCGGAPAVTEYDLTISSTTGGSVTTPGEGTDTYDEGEVVNLVATPDAGYHFVNWTGDVSTIGNVDAAITTIVMNGDYSIAAEFATPKNIWLSGLITNLEDDTTDENEYIVNVYDDENFAKDLEDNLEELDYDVTFLTVFEFDGTLLWVPLLKIRYSEDFAVLVNPRTDDIVTEAYDGDGDGATETLVGMNLTEVSSWLYELVSTGLGNDGQYLILGFDDYDTVELADTTVGKNITDLKKDLAANNISKRTWVPGTYDCDDFARDLEDDLEALGYNVTIKLVYWWAWNGTAWNFEIVDPIGGDWTTTSIAVDSHDYPHISYSNRSRDSLKYATKSKSQQSQRNDGENVMVQDQYGKKSGEGDFKSQHAE